MFAIFAGMKILCLLSSIYVFCLSTVPCCSGDDCDDEIKTEHTEDHSHDHTDNDFDTCSPFLTCGACSGFVFSKSGFAFTEVYFHVDKLITVYTPQFTDDFYANIWQPPKIS